jgi:Ca2+-binding RTX toxin-like protein
MVGETFSRIISQQFQALRDGDRYWYQNQGFDPQTLREIETTTLSSLILRNSDTEHLQADAFVYTERRSGQQGGVAADPLAPQLVVGADGGDWLIGGARGDTLVAGSGRQVLTGGAGADAFVFSKLGTQGEITDFTPGVDHLQFEMVRGGFGWGSTGPADLRVGEINGNATVLFGGDTVTLLGVSAMQLRPGDIQVMPLA